MCFQEMRQAGQHFADTIWFFVSFNRSSKSIKRLIWLGWIFKLLMDSSRMSTGAYSGLGEKRNTSFFKSLQETEKEHLSSCTKNVNVFFPPLFPLLEEINGLHYITNTLGFIQYKNPTCRHK